MINAKAGISGYDKGEMHFAKPAGYGDQNEQTRESRGYDRRPLP
jgi:hypothetical protein